MKRAALYCRVSTEEQASDGMSIAAQRKALLEYAERNGISVVDSFIDEGASARTGERPEFQRMIRAARARPRPFDIILVHKTDRFARNREDAVMYKALLRRECGIEVVSVTEQFDDSPTGRLLEGIMEVIAEFYSLNLSQEVKKGMKEKASRGGKGLGMTPFGYTLSSSGDIIMVPEEARVVQFLFQAYASGKHTLSSLAELMRTRGFELFGDVALRLKWSVSGIRNMLRNPAYTGTLVWNRRENVGGTRRFRVPEQWVVVKGSHEPVISTELFQKANSVMARKNRSRTAGAQDYLLKGIIYCADCGGPMCSARVSWRLKEGGSRSKRLLSCSRYHNHRQCYYNHTGMEELTEAVMLTLRNLLRGFIGPKDVRLERISGLPPGNLESTRARLEAIENAFQRQFQAYEAGLITLTQLKATHQRLEAERARLLRETAVVDRDQDDAVRRRVEMLLENLDDSEMAVSERRAALKTILVRVEYSQRDDLLRLIMAIPPGLTHDDDWYL